MSRRIEEWPDHLEGQLTFTIHSSTGELKAVYTESEVRAAADDGEGWAIEALAELGELDAELS